MAAITFKPNRPHSSLTSSLTTLPSHFLPILCLLLLLILSPLTTSAQTTSKPSLASAASAASNTLGALASASSAAASSGSGSSSSAGSHAIGAAGSFLYSIMGAPTPSVTNPYPIRTMIGNMYWRLRQHKTPLMIIPPVMRLLYQFRGPISSALTSTFKGMGANPAAAAGLAAKGAADLASAASSNMGNVGLLGPAAAGAATFGANPGFMFPGPMGMPGAFPTGLMSPVAASPFQPVFRK